MTIHQLPQRELDLPMEVLGVLKRQAEPSISEMAHDIEMRFQKRYCAGTYRAAIKIIEHPDVDVTRYSLVEPEGAA